MQGMPPTPSLGANWTPLTRNVLVGLFVIYVVQLLSGGLLDRWLAWHPLQAGFLPWQPVTSFLLGGPTPINAIFDWLVLYFTIAPLESILGRKGLFQSVAVAWATAVAVGFLLAASGVVAHGGAVYGLTPLIAALISLFGFLMPGATIMLFFVLPIKAIWIAWGTGLFTFLNLLYSRDLPASLAFFAWSGAWLFIALRGGAMRRLKLRWKKAAIERKLARFEVIEGGRTGPTKSSKKSGTDDWVH
jgi:membrane associated rhomboid family serine protease